jgi:hypothetical protein
MLRRRKGLNLSTASGLGVARPRSEPGRLFFALEFLARSGSWALGPSGSWPLRPLRRTSSVITDFSTAGGTGSAAERAVRGAGGAVSGRNAANRSKWAPSVLRGSRTQF